MELTGGQVLALRMASLLLRDDATWQGMDGVPPRPGSVAAVVEWFGAMQSQDLASGVWSLGVRLPGFGVAGVEAALERGEVLRTWPMRGTVHLVPSRDAAWMVELTGARVLPTLARRREQLEISDVVAEQACELWAQALAGGTRLTREQMLETLRDKGIDTSGQRGYHLLAFAAHRGVLCFGPNAGKQQTFVLLAEWAPDPHRPDRDEALATLAQRYFRSHGPTTVKDFAGWTGLTLGDARRAIAAAGERIATARFADVDVHLDPSLLDRLDTIGRQPQGQVWALPGFDEYLLGYKDRSLMLAPEHFQAVVPGGNGVFQPTIVRDGRVVATWRRTVTAHQLTIDVAPLLPLPPADRRRAEAALQHYAAHLTLPPAPAPPCRVLWRVIHASALTKGG